MSIRIREGKKSTIQIWSTFTNFSVFMSKPKKEKAKKLDYFDQQFFFLRVKRFDLNLSLTSHLYQETY